MSSSDSFNHSIVSDIAVIILTGEEELHIRRCLAGLQPLMPKQVFVVDCLSKDKTVVIAKSMGATVVEKAWPGTQAAQFNWALENLPIMATWVLRLDADEYLSPELVTEIHEKLGRLPEEVTGVAFNLQRMFMGRMIRRGIPTISMIRLFRHGQARCEQRLMDERITLRAGHEVTFSGAFVDHNLNDLSWWTQKHVGYAIREAASLLDLEYGLFADGNQQLAVSGVDGIRKVSNADGHKGGGLGAQAAAKRRMKLRYARAPLFWRAFFYFCVRFVVRGGFLEGKEGFMWHFFQGLWYRMLVDAKIWEIKREAGSDREKMLELLRGKYGLKV